MSTNQLDFPSTQESELALELAQRCGFRAALATLHHLRGDYAAALQCHLMPQHTSTGSGVTVGTIDGSVAGGGDGGGAFRYVRSFLEDGGATAAQRTAMYGALLAAAPQLVAADPWATAQVCSCGLWTHRGLWAGCGNGLLPGAWLVDGIIRL